MSKIHDIQKGSGDVDVSNGYYAVDPSDHLILIPPLQKLKGGWRLAERADFPMPEREQETAAPGPFVAAPIDPDRDVVEIAMTSYAQPVEEIVEVAAVVDSLENYSDRD